VRSQYSEKQLLLVVSSCLSVRMEQLGCHWPDFHEIWYFGIFRKSVMKIQVTENLPRVTDTLHEDQCTVL